MRECGPLRAWEWRPPEPIRLKDVLLGQATSIMRSKMSATQNNQGEGNRSAARSYNKKTEDFAKSGQVKEKAQAARNALEGDEQKELEHAEDKGRVPARK